MNEPKWTPGPWEVDTVDNEGTYGDGPDCHSGFKSYEVRDEKGRVLFDSINSDAAEIHEEWADDELGSSHHAWDEVARRNLTLAGAAPDMALVLELLAAEADAGTVMIPSALRLTIDAALIKAGRKAALEPVRVVTIAGGAA